MDFKSKGRLAATAGLTAVLALSPIAMPAVTALAEGTDGTAEAQSSRISLIKDHKFVDEKGWFGRGDGLCDICCAMEWMHCKWETLTVNFHLTDGNTVPISIDTPVGDQVPFGSFVNELGSQYSDVTWYWTDFEDAEKVSLDSQIGGQGDKVINVYQHEEKPEEPVQEGYRVFFRITDPETGNPLTTSYYTVEDGSTQRVETGEIPPVPAFDGWELEGWASESGQVYTAEQLGGLLTSEDTTFTTQWKRADVEEPTSTTHKVTFDDCLPNTPNLVVEVEDGQAVARPTSDPTCEGYTFLGWYADAYLTQEYDFSTPVTEDMTLWAKWERDAAGQPGEDAPTAPSSDDAAKNAGSKGDELPQTGDATVAVSGIAALGAATVGLGAFLRRRR